MDEYTPSLAAVTKLNMKAKNKKHSNRSDWEVIVIGSGIGGMAAAAALSKVGHKVLLLEQYSTLGGLTHSYTREGFKWDAGIHYLGDVAPICKDRKFLDWICDIPIEMTSAGSVYDTVHIGNAPPLKLSRPTESQKMDLKERFPDEADNIDKWFDYMKAGRELLRVIGHLRSMPIPFATATKWLHHRKLEQFAERTTAEVIDEVTSNPELASVLSAQWGDFGGIPDEACFALHAGIVGSYLDVGGWYPTGGAASFAKHILPTITEAGGEARSGVCVDTLLMDDDHHVIGVETTDGECLYSDKVISNIGVKDTVEELLPDDHGQQEWVDEINSFDVTMCHFSLCMGFSGDIESAGATTSNHWLYPTGKVNRVWSNAPNGRPPSMFTSFASLKDPAHDPGPEQKHSGEIVAWADWSTVEKWAGKARGNDYQDFKKQVQETLFSEFAGYFPRVAELTVYKELSTPLTTVEITGHNKGGFYGLEVTPRRFMSDALRIKTPINGLYLSGQDVVSPGIPGALWGGLLCAACVDPKIFKEMFTD